MEQDGAPGRPGDDSGRLSEILGQIGRVPIGDIDQRKMLADLDAALPQNPGATAESVEAPHVEISAPPQGRRHHDIHSAISAEDAGDSGPGGYLPPVPANPFDTPANAVHPAAVDDGWGFLRQEHPPATEPLPPLSLHDRATDTSPSPASSPLAPTSPGGDDAAAAAAPKPDVKSSQGPSAGAAASRAQAAVAKFRSWDRRVQMLVGMAVVLVLLVLIALVGGGSKKPSSSSPAAGSPGQTQVQAPPSLPPTGTTGVLAPSSVTAECPDGSTRAELAFSTDKRDAWVCKRAQGIDGATMTINFSQPVVITEIKFVPGFNYVEASGIDRWGQYRLVSTVLWTFSADSAITQSVTPVRTGVDQKVNSIATQSIQLTVLDTVAGGDKPNSTGTPDLFGPSAQSPATSDAFALSHLQIIGHQA